MASKGLWGQACPQKVIAWERTNALDGKTIQKFNYLKAVFRICISKRQINGVKGRSAYLIFQQDSVKPFLKDVFTGNSWYR